LARKRSRTLTHFDRKGRAHMVDVGAKDETSRVAVASGSIRMRGSTLQLVTSRTAKKGDVLGVARIAAIQAAKRTPALIPLAHPIALSRVAVEFDVDRRKGAIHVTATVACVGRTGVEMEALTAAAVGLLTIYDMLKAVDRGMSIREVRLQEKRGGASGHWVRARPAR